MASAPLLRAGALLRTLLLLLLFATASAAQEPAPPDFDVWTETVQRVEDLVANPNAGEQVLTDLRRELSETRQLFQDAESLNRSQIERVNRQLETLGPPPADGETEPEAVAERRAALNEELAALQNPGLRAREAYVAADALISEVDRVLRERQARKVFARAPSPLNPLNWPIAVNELREIGLTIPSRIISSLQSEEKRQAAWETLPVAVGTMVVGALLLFRSSKWIDRFNGWLSTVRSGPFNVVLRGVLALLQLGLPTAGLLGLLAGLEITGLFGDAGSDLLLSIGAFATTLVVGLWLVRRLFPTEPGSLSPLMLKPRQVLKGRIVSRFLIILLAVFAAMSTFAEQAQIDLVTRRYAIFTVAVVMALLLIRIARLFVVSTRVGPQDSEARSFSAGVVRVVATIGTLVCIVAILAGLAGYLTLAERMIVPSTVSFLLFGFLALLQQGFTDFYAAVSSRENPTEEGLLPTLFGATLIVLSLPVLALLWGALPTDLMEFLNRMQAGFTLGEVQISPAVVLRLLIVFSILLGMTRLLQNALRTTILPKTRIDKGGRNAIVSGVGYIGILLAGLLAFTSAGINLSSLAIFASALAIGVGFGLQTIVSNFVSGIILLIERPVSEGDWIEVAGQMGYVRRISVRSTRIETFDRTDVIVPNSDLISGVVTNWTRGNLIGRVIIPIGVAYGTDTRKVERILTEIAEAQPMVVLSPPPAVLFIGFGDSSLNFEIRAILRDINFMLAVHSDVNHEIAKRFAEEGIEVPFPQRDVWLRRQNDRGGGSSGEPGTGAPAYRAPPQPDSPDADGDADR